ncbi:hypothetical protein QYE76_055713 [Lolium multiflorum]|uniref:RNase H type-1 domain-containing protein n=1 Tax=Lolium multiflorum TaxID=4521 RepID=A0AAD8WM55_LOLMU|nr:hypothetical protein QYE76_055713 [Lolium multiflorum]
MRSAAQSLAGAATQSLAGPRPSLAQATRAAPREGSHRSRSQHQEGRGESDGGSKKSDRPPRRKDHPAIVPKECYALVVSPRIDGYDFSKCLMDGGASLNIMYLETLERMNLTKEQLKHNNTEFHGVVPGKKANSLGSITLPVAFGDVHNFREEKITFEVVPFKSSYHVIFGRPTYHKFHARACYIYNKLKIPGPKGATYQRTMQRCLKDQIGRNVHAYVDDIAVMTRKGSDLISDLTETFDNLRSIKARGRSHPKSPLGEELQYVLQIHFGYKQHGEYEALLHGLRIAKEIGIKHIICCGDSDLVAQQVAGTWNARNSVMAAYRDEVDEIAKCFLGYEVKYVRRDDNTAVDMLSKLGSGRKAFSWSISGYPQLRALTGKPRGGSISG